MIHFKLVSLTALLVLMLGFNTINAQINIDPNAPDWYQKSNEKEFFVEVKASAEIFPVALGKALGKLFFDESESVIASNHSLGILDIQQGIEFEDLKREDGETDTLRKEVIRISFSEKSDDGLLFELYFEESPSGVMGDYKLSFVGPYYTQMINSLDSLGVRIEQKTTPTVSFVKLLVPLELLDMGVVTGKSQKDSELYEQFKKSAAFEKLKKQDN